MLEPMEHLADAAAVEQFGVARPGHDRSQETLWPFAREIQRELGQNHFFIDLAARGLLYLEGTRQAQDLLNRREEWTQRWLADAAIMPVFLAYDLPKTIPTRRTRLGLPPSTTV
jgi:hypothetical protein